MAAKSEEWKLIDTIKTKRGTDHYLIGSVGEQSVALKDTRTRNVFAINLANRERTRASTRVAVSQDNLYRCVSLGGHGTEGPLVACGTRNGNIIIIKSFGQFEWTVFKEIQLAVPHTASILLTVATDGTLMAAAYGSFDIHLINPNDWSVTERQTDPAGAVIIHEMHAMADGHIAIRTSCSPENKDVCILNISGAIVHTLHLHDKDVYGIAVNKANNSILVLYRDRERDDFTVDVFSASGELSAQRILSFRKATVTYLTFCWLNSNHIAIHEDAESDIYVYSPKGLDLL